MGKLVNRAMMTVVGAPGTGAITLGSAVAGYLSFAAAGVTDGDVVSYVAESGYSNGRPLVFEFGLGTYSSTGPTLTRTSVVGGSSGTSPVALTADAQVYVNPLAADIPSGILHVQYQVASGTDGGSITNNAWTPRAINTVVSNEIAGASLASNRVTLPAGSFLLTGLAVFKDLSTHVKLRLRNITAGVTTKVGATFDSAGSWATAMPIVQGKFSIATPALFELQYYTTSTASAGYNLGQASSSGEPEVYVDMLFTRFGQ